MDSRQSRRGKRISKQQEKQAAADLGGRLQAGSGAAKFSGGGDVRVMGKLRVECKYTENDSYSLKFSELEKLWKQAIKALEFPVFQFAFKDPSGRLEKYAVIPWDLNVTAKEVIEVEAKSWTFRRHSTKAMTANQGWVQLIFHVKEGTSLRSRYYRLLGWDDFVEGQGTDA